MVDSHRLPEQDEIRYADGRIEHPHVRHERTDVGFRPVLMTILAALGFAAFVHWVVLEFFYSYRGHQAAIKQSPFPLASTPSVAPPQEPRLEQIDRLSGNQTPNVFERQLEAENILRRYGPTEEKGYIRIPIERAMDRVADKLPVRKEARENQRGENGLVDAGAANSGRLLRGKPK